MNYQKTFLERNDYQGPESGSATSASYSPSASIPARLENQAQPCNFATASGKTVRPAGTEYPSDPAGVVIPRKDKPFLGQDPLGSKTGYPGRLLGLPDEKVAPFLSGGSEIPGGAGELTVVRGNNAAGSLAALNGLDDCRNIGCLAQHFRGLVKCQAVKCSHWPYAKPDEKPKLFHTRLCQCGEPLLPRKRYCSTCRLKGRQTRKDRPRTHRAVNCEKMEAK